jgi:signal transduction histidine kinase/tetratricopeptide (TPR) repeat protein
MKRFTIIVFIYFFHFAMLKAQSKIGFITQLNQAKTDSQKVLIYFKMAKLQLKTDSLYSPKLCMENAKLILNKINWDFGNAKYNTELVYNNILKGNFDTAKVLLEKNIAYCKTKKYNNLLTDNYLYYGTYFLMQEKIDQASEYYVKAYDLSKSLQLKEQMCYSSSNLATMYLMQENFTKYLKYSDENLKMALSIKDTVQIADNYGTLGAGYFAMKKDTLQAIKYILKSLELYKKTNNLNGIAVRYKNLSTLEKNALQKLNYLLEVEKIYQQNGDNTMRSINNKEKIGFAYFAIANNNEDLKKISKSRTEVLSIASKYISSAIDFYKSRNLTMLYANLQLTYSEFQAQNNDYKSAYLNLKNATKLNDSIFSQESKNKLAALESKQTIDKKNTEIALNKAKVKAKSLQNIFLIIGLILASLLGLLIFKQSINRKETNRKLSILNNQLLEANNVKARFFAILSHDLRAPIAQIISFINIQKLQPDIFDEKSLQLHQLKISQNAEILLQNMEQMLLWSKSQMEIFKPNYTNVEINELFDYIKKFFNAESEEILFYFENNENIKLKTDENYLKTMMQNITANAVKSLKNQANAQIKWQCVKSNQNIKLIASDNGKGLSKTQLLQFNNANFENSNNFSGLGMHIVHDFAIKLNYTIRFENIIPSGLQVIIEIPL